MASRIKRQRRLMRAADDGAISLEAQLADGPEAADAMAEILERLGFHPVAEVSKRRQEMRLKYRGRDVAVALDDVDQVGLFAELETIAEEADVPSARQTLESLAQELGLEGSIRTSYLEMLLEKRSDPGSTRPGV